MLGTYSAYLTKPMPAVLLETVAVTVSKIFSFPFMMAHHRVCSLFLERNQSPAGHGWSHPARSGVPFKLKCHF